MSHKEKKLVVGGGISGLLSAYNLMKQGVPAADITIYEADKRVGGKIISGKIGDYTVNMGAEFIDEENVKMRKLAEEIGVKLLPTGEQSTELFQSPSGRMMPNFLKDFAPIARRMEQLHAAMIQDHALAEQMKSISAKELMDTLGKQVVVNENPGLIGSIGNFLYDTMMKITLRPQRANRVSQEVIDTALHAATKELGASSHQITAAQFLSEFSPSEDRFLASTCDYRVEGGTEALVSALHKRLQESGVTFEQGHKLESVQRQNDEKHLTFSTPDGEKKITSGNVIIALPAYALPKIQWLDGNGNPDKTMAFLNEMSDVQYTQNAKITFKVKPGVKLPTDHANAFLAMGECWSPDPGYLTVLAHNEKGEAPLLVMQKAMNGYAQAFGLKAEDVFEMDNGRPLAGSFVYTNPGQAPCWSTPSPENHHQMEQHYAKMASMSDQGLGFAGTYIPLPDGEVGFMECGAASAEHVCERMIAAERAHSKSHVQEHTRAHAPAHGHEAHAPSFAERALAEKNAANNAITRGAV